MADEPISALTLFTSYSTADEVEILDVSDTTFASTGTNKRIQFSTLLTMAGVGSGGGGGSGTVTSVGLSLPPFITVTGSPVSTSGTLTGTLATQTANTHFAGPTSGSAAAPTFRALVAADLPSITYGAIQNESASTFLGNPTGSPAAPSEITLYPNLGFVGYIASGQCSNMGSYECGHPDYQQHLLNVDLYRCFVHRVTHDPGEHAPGRQPTAVQYLRHSVRERYKFSDAHDQVPSRRRYARVVDDASSSDHLQWHRLDNLRVAHRFLGASDRLVREDYRCRGIQRLRVDRKSFQQQRPQRPALPGHDQHDDSTGCRPPVPMVGGLCV